HPARLVWLHSWGPNKRVRVSARGIQVTRSAETSFAGLLRRFRIAAELTKTALAERAALSREALSALEARRLLVNDRVRPVMLTGPGGVGKFVAIPSVALFTTRARAVRPEFELGAAPARLRRSGGFRPSDVGRDGVCCSQAGGCLACARGN